MTGSDFSSFALFLSLLLLFIVSGARAEVPEVNLESRTSSIPESDVFLLEFPLNLEFVETEFFAYASLGCGLSDIAPNLTMGGPLPIGAEKANLDPLLNDIFAQFAFQEIGHVRAIKNAVVGFPRPLIDLSKKVFATAMDKALKCTLEPPFDPYADSLSFLVASYVFPYVGITGYVGANPHLKSPKAKRLVAGLLSVESAQDAVIRTLLYERKNEIVQPYNITVAEFTERISELRNELGGHGVKDEGIIVHATRGPEGSTPGNIIAGNQYSLAYKRTPEEILRIVYGSGSAKEPGAFFPNGANGRIARSFLNKETEA